MPELASGGRVAPDIKKIPPSLLVRRVRTLLMVREKERGSKGGGGGVSGRPGI